MNKESWVTENTYEFEKDERGDLFVIKSDTNSEMEMIKQKLPDNSVTKDMLNELEREKLI